MKAALQNYQARMRRVLDYIDRHLDSDLDLETVSGVAAFSKFHFHRQFTATFGLSVHRYVQLARMKRASHRLAYMDAQSVTDIAMDAGYDAPDAFALPRCLMASPARAIGLHHLFASIQSGRNIYGARCSSRFAATFGA